MTNKAAAKRDVVFFMTRDLGLMGWKLPGMRRRDYTIGDCELRIAELEL